MVCWHSGLYEPKPQNFLPCYFPLIIASTFSRLEHSEPFSCLQCLSCSLSHSCRGSPCVHSSRECPSGNVSVTSNTKVSALCLTLKLISSTLGYKPWNNFFFFLFIPIASGCIKNKPQEWIVKSVKQNFVELRFSNLFLLPFFLPFCRCVEPRW